MSTNIIDFVHAARRIKVAVVGDCMVDEYHYVNVNRISPEFPIPVWLSPGDEMAYALPGGAANVAYQFKHFHHDVELIGFVNPYSASIYDKAGVRHHNSWHGECHVPVKRRLYQGDFPLCRWDIERHGYGLPRTAWWELPRSVEADVVIFSDYDKGIFDVTGKIPEDVEWSRYILGKLRRQGVTTIVDPKNDLSKWAGCTIFKPNSVEAERLTGHKGWRDQAKALLDTVCCKSVVITQGGDGVVGMYGDQEFEYRPRRRTENVVSLQGAGDCFVAFMAMAAGLGHDLPAAAEIAFEAGSLYVQNKHNEPIRPEQLLHSVNPAGMKYVMPEYLSERGGKKLVFANGCFDVLHRGHVETLRFAKQQGDLLVAAVNGDESVRRLKGPGRPVNDLESRMRVLAALGDVDYVVSFDEDKPLRCIEKCRPDVIVKAADYKPEDVVGGDLAKVVIAPYVEGFSTTAITRRL